MEKRLAAILISDIVGYTKLMEEDTEGTVMAWSDARDNVVDPQVEASNGRLVKFMGDGFLAEFSTVQTALECAIAIQNGVKDNSLKFRMAVHMGDIIDDGRDIYGEGINIASRLEGIAEPGGICISGDVFNQVRNRIPADYEDMGPQEVKNVAAPVQAYAVRFDKMPEYGEDSSEPKLAERPSIAVLPFNNMSNDPDQEYFSDGITEDIITALSHLRWLNVIARNSSFSYKGQSPDIRKVSEELNSRYVLEGSIQKAGKRVRINAQLLEGATGNHIWAEKYDRELEDIFDLQDEITSKVVLQIRPELEKFELKRAQGKTPESMDAWDLFQRGKWAFYSSNGATESIPWFELSEKADSQYIDATAFKVSSAIAANNLFNRSYELEDDYEKLQQGRVADPDNDLVHTGIGFYNFWGLKRPDEAISIFATAIELNPTNMLAQRLYAMCLIYLDRPQEALNHFDEIRGISPKDPENLRMDTRRAEANLCLSNFEEAKRYGQLSISHPITTWPSFAVLISSLGHLGETDEARSAINKMKNKIESNPQVEADPDEILSYQYIKKSLPFIDNQFAEIYLTGLQKASFPD